MLSFMGIIIGLTSISPIQDAFIIVLYCTSFSLDALHNYLLTKQVNSNMALILKVKERNLTMTRNNITELLVIVMIQLFEFRF